MTRTPAKSPARMGTLLALTIAFAAVAWMRLSQMNGASAAPLSVVAANGPAISCPVTKPPSPSFLPPHGYPSDSGPTQFWFGTAKLWTSLPLDGTWKGLGHYTPDDPTYRQKLFFFRQGFAIREEPSPKLTLTGRRLDAAASPLQSGTSNGWQDERFPFMVAGVNFPTLGCWEITADYHGDKLTFVVWLE
jgi:hypothetical protein